MYYLQALWNLCGRVPRVLHIQQMGGGVMSDLISRQDAIDAVMKYGKRIPTFAIAVKDALENLPSAQPEIIRCRDCKHYYYADNRIPQEQMCTCDLDGDRWSPNSYCSFAERKTE